MKYENTIYLIPLSPFSFFDLGEGGEVNLGGTPDLQKGTKVPFTFL